MDNDLQRLQANRYDFGKKYQNNSVNKEIQLALKSSNAQDKQVSITSANRSLKKIKKVDKN